MRADGVIPRDVAKSALAVYDVDEVGLDRLDRAVLSTLSRSLRRRAGMIARTPRGRVATPQAWTHLGMTPPPRASGLGQPGLFDS